jgi:ribosomal protein L37E
MRVQGLGEEHRGVPPQEEQCPRCGQVAQPAADRCSHCGWNSRTYAPASLSQSGSRPAEPDLSGFVAEKYAPQYERRLARTTGEKLIAAGMVLFIGSSLPLAWLMMEWHAWPLALILPAGAACLLGMLAVVSGLILVLFEWFWGKHR